MTDLEAAWSELNSLMPEQWVVSPASFGPETCIWTLDARDRAAPAGVEGPRGGWRVQADTELAVVQALLDLCRQHHQLSLYLGRLLADIAMNPRPSAQ